MSEQDFKTLFFKAAALLREREFVTRSLKTYVRTECLTCGASIVGHNPPAHREGEAEDSDRILRTVKEEYVEGGFFNPGEDVTHEIRLPYFARILCSANMPRKGEQDREGNRMRQLVGLLNGEPQSTFYANYKLHPESVEQAKALQM